MTNPTYLNTEGNPDPSYQTYRPDDTSRVSKSFDEYEYELAYVNSIPKEELSGKAHLTNEQIGGISLLVSAVFFGILALIFPPASPPYAVYLGLSLSCALAGGALLAPGKPVEVPSEPELFCEF